MADDINYIDDLYRRTLRKPEEVITLPKDYGPLQVDQSKILLEAYRQGLEPQIAQQKALEESVGSQIKAIGEMKSPERSDLADAIMLLGAPLLGALGGEAGALSAPKAYAGASDIYEKQLKAAEEKAAAKRKLGYERLEEDKKRLATLGTEIAKGRFAGGEKIAEMELEKFKQQQETKRAEIMSAGQKAFDVESAKESARWLQSGGYVSGKKDINVLDDALSQLSEGKVKSGGLVGLRSLAGKNIQDFTDSDWVTFESKIQSVFAGGLSKLLPGSITEKEREWFLSLSTNPRLSPEQNYE